MHVRHAGNERPLDALGVCRRRERDVDGANRAVAGDIDKDVMRPARGQQRIAGE